MERLDLETLAACTGFPLAILQQTQALAPSPLCWLHHEVYFAEAFAPDAFSVPVRVTPGVRLENCAYDVVEVEAEGIFFAVDKGDSSEVLAALRQHLQTQGYLPFIYANHLATAERARLLHISYGEALKNQNEELIAVIQSDSDLDIPRLQGTHGCNCGGATMTYCANLPHGRRSVSTRLWVRAATGPNSNSRYCPTT
jgi:hypothetical protein